MSTVLWHLQEFSPSGESEGKVVKMGDFVRDIFLNQVRTTPSTISLLLSIRIYLSSRVDCGRR